MKLLSPDHIAAMAAYGAPLYEMSEDITIPYGWFPKHSVDKVVNSLKDLDVDVAAVEALIEFVLAIELEERE